MHICSRNSSGASLDTGTLQNPSDDEDDDLQFAGF